MARTGHRDRKFWPNWQKSADGRFAQIYRKREVQAENCTVIGPENPKSFPRPRFLPTEAGAVL